MMPQLMMKIWDGDPDERFKALDMNRLGYNTNILAREAGVPQEVFPEVTPADQFDYTVAQRLESLQGDIASAIGADISIESTWGVNRSLSYVDFERWEANNWTLYKAMGGLGERIPNDKFIHTVTAILPAKEWVGMGPFHMDIDVPMVRTSSEIMAHLSHRATVPQQAEAYNALLHAQIVSDRKIRVWASAHKPTTDLPLIIASRVYDMNKQITLKSSSWSGSGPWTQTVDLESIVSSAVVGPDERATAEMMKAFASGIIGISGINGSTVTFRAVGTKPTIDLYATVMWAQSGVA